jgi:hypothetical protein
MLYSELLCVFITKIQIGYDSPMSIALINSILRVRFYIDLKVYALLMCKYHS